MKKYISLSIAASALLAAVLLVPGKTQAQTYMSYPQSYYANQTYYGQSYGQSGYSNSYPYYQYSQYPYYQTPYTYQNSYYPSYPYNNYNNYNNYYNYAPLVVSCYPNMQSTTVGRYVTWTASVSGGMNNYYPTNYYSGSYNYGNYYGNRNYIFTWSGEGIVNSNSSVVSAYYGTPGNKYATVTVSSGSQAVTRSCGSIYVNQSYPYYYPYQYPW